MRILLVRGAGRGRTTASSSRGRGRRSFLRCLVPLGLLVAVAAASSPAQSEPLAANGDDRPNVLIIITDDQREGLSVMPKTRRWFEAGTRYENAFATTPLCCPARASIMTGLYTHNHGVAENRRRALKNMDTRKTIQAQLQTAGYRTALFGKYLNRWPVTEGLPRFDEWAVRETSGKTAYYGGAWNVNGHVKTIERYSTTYIARRGVDFIRTSTDPWLMYLTPSAPHFPFKPEPRYARAPVGPWRSNPAIEEADRTDKPPYVRISTARLSESKRVRRRQFRTLKSVDDLVARVARALEETGQADDTLVFFLSDNSAVWGDHGLGLQAKNVPYMPAIKVPFLVRWPGRIDEGEEDALVANIDIAPTVLEAAGVEPTAPLDGRSLLGSPSRERLLTENLDRFNQVPEWAGLVLKDGRHYIEHYDEAGRAVFHELYRLDSDPWELENLLYQADTTVPDPELAALLAKDRLCTGDSCP